MDNPFDPDKLEELTTPQKIARKGRWSPFAG